MDVYAAQQMFGRGPHVRSHRSRAQARHRRSPTRERELERAARAGIRRPAAGRPRAAGRVDARRLLDDGEHLQRVRALHRHVHHLQLVCDRRHASGARRSASCARSARRAAQIRWLFLGESAVMGIARLDRRAWRSALLIARGIAVGDRRAARRRLRRRAAGVDELAHRARSLLASGVGHRRRDERRGRRCIPAAQCRARRSGAGAAERAVSDAVGRREPRPRGRSRPCSRLLVGRACSSDGSRPVFYAGYAVGRSPRRCCSGRCCRSGWREALSAPPADGCGRSRARWPPTA